MKKLILTEEQKNIISLAGKMQDGEYMKINACAGSGKTATLLEIVRAYPRKRFLYIVFNRENKEEMKRRGGYRNVDILTTHGLAHRELHIHSAVISSYRLDKLCAALGVMPQELRNAGFQKQFSDFLHTDDVYPPEEIADYFFGVLEAARCGAIPYTHDLYLKEYMMLLASGEMELDCYDYILLDEAQDTNPAVYGIFQLAAGRKIMVGDVNQNIYSFRKTINVMKRQTDYVGQLTKCFRCASEHLAKAEALLRYYDHPTEVMVSAHEPVEDDTKAILCRTNSSIFSIFKYAMEKKLDGRIRFEKDPKEFLAGPVDLWHYLQNDDREEYVIPQHKDEFDRYCERLGIDDFEKYIPSEDCQDTELKSDYELQHTLGSDIVSIYEGMEANFKSRRRKDGRIILTSGHKAKGREWDTVLLYSDYDIEKFRKQFAISLSKLKASRIPAIEKDRRIKELTRKFKITLENEVNLYYAGLTRARESVLDFTANSSFLSSEYRLAEGNDEKQRKLLEPFANVENSEGAFAAVVQLIGGKLEIDDTFEDVSLEWNDANEAIEKVPDYARIEYLENRVRFLEAEIGRLLRLLEKKSDTDDNERRV